MKRSGISSTAWRRGSACPPAIGIIRVEAPWPRCVSQSTYPSSTGSATTSMASSSARLAGAPLGSRARASSTNAAPISTPGSRCSTSNDLPSRTVASGAVSLSSRITCGSSDPVVRAVTMWGPESAAFSGMFIRSSLDGCLQALLEHHFAGGDLGRFDRGIQVMAESCPVQQPGGLEARLVLEQADHRQPAGSGAQDHARDKARSAVQHSTQPSPSRDDLISCRRCPYIALNHCVHRADRLVVHSLLVIPPGSMRRHQRGVIARRYMRSLYIFGGAPIEVSTNPSVA